MRNFLEKGEVPVEKQQSRSAAISLAVIAFVILVAIGLVVELIRLYAPGVWAAFSSGNGNALEACFEGEGRVYSACLLWLLSFVQVVSIVLPSLPIQLVAGIVLGPWIGAAVCLSAGILSHMTVFALGKRAKRLLNTVAVTNPRLGKLMKVLSVSRNRTYVTVMVLLAPGLPNGIIPYAAANSGIVAKAYLLALCVALPLPTLITCAAGKGILAGDWLVSVIMLGALYAIVGVLFVNRDRLPDKVRGLVKK